MIELESHPDGIYLRVRAQPGAQRAGVRGEQNGQLKVSVTAVAEKGKANRALLKVLSKALRVRRSQVELISGETSAHKRFRISGVSQQELAERLQAVLAEA